MKKRRKLEKKRKSAEKKNRKSEKKKEEWTVDYYCNPQLHASASTVISPHDLVSLLTR
jgi:hypothetical protein